jgi:hypothetical protein
VNASRGRRGMLYADRQNQGDEHDELKAHPKEHGIDYLISVRDKICCFCFDGRFRIGLQA